MNENNVKYLTDQVKYTGFGDKLELPIIDNIGKGQPEFQVTFQPNFGKEAEATLHFRQSDQGNYFFNKYDLSVQQENGVALKQTFLINSSQQVPLMDKNGAPVLDEEGKQVKVRVNSNISLKEAYNMLDVDEKGMGRSVLKDYSTKGNEVYQSWTRLDFTSQDNKGNYAIKKSPSFDLEMKLGEYKGLEHILSNPESKKQLMESLQRGNAQEVNMSNGDLQYKRVMVVHPESKDIRLYDKGQNRISNSQEKAQANREQQSATTTQQQGNSQPNAKGQKSTQDSVEDKAASEKKSQGSSKKKGAAIKA